MFFTYLPFITYIHNQHKHIHCPVISPRIQKVSSSIENHHKNPDNPDSKEQLISSFSYLVVSGVRELSTEKQINAIGDFQTEDFEKFCNE